MYTKYNIFEEIFNENKNTVKTFSFFDVYKINGIPSITTHKFYEYLNSKIVNYDG